VIAATGAKASACSWLPWTRSPIHGDFHVPGAPGRRDVLAARESAHGADDAFEERPAADANLGCLFRLAYQRWRALLDDQLDDDGLSAPEYAILSVFETRGELSTSELARIAQVTRQTMHPAASDAAAGVC
jgi:hypothetical protein